MLTWILAAGAVVCLAYLTVIIVYSGVGTASVWIWLLFAGILGAAAASSFRCQKYPEQTAALRLPVTLVTLCGAGLVILLLLQIMIFGRIPAVAEPMLDYVIVLGAQVKPEGPSRTLRLRLDKAAEYAAQNPETILVLSGGMGENEVMSEAESMRDYLLEKGVPESRMLLESRSANTRENMVYSLDLIHRQREFPIDGSEPGFGRPLGIGILTSNFHLYRATKIAQKQGMTDVRGIASGSDPVLLVHFAIRDALAFLKDRLAGNL